MVGGQLFEALLITAVHRILFWVYITFDFAVLGVCFGGFGAGIISVVRL
ncbi:MAG: hypothetical protein H6611_00740 [Ignavibacteriales bacterium]|nr:hypothetical protein [Ignavibacteriales bacterium]